MIDDQKMISKNQIQNFLSEEKKAIIFSGLSRLQKKKYIKVIKKGKFNYYSVSNYGQDYLYSTIDWIKQNDKTQNWKLICFSIPEKQKSLREQFRNMLIENGFSQIQRGVMLGKVSDKILNYLINHYHCEKFTHIFHEPTFDVNIIAPTNKTIEHYEEFIDEAKNFLRHNKKFRQEQKRFQAKILVYIYATALKYDNHNQDIEKIRQQAGGFYQKIKTYCYL
ncbi:MAG: hypothetical protein CEN89_667 [Candidatus Berkelbacteria bacterium Licking1014_7]|uniref:Transcriptional repressor PaaX-like central Cas2-like domain-containing protein n=1 Tax=Candidatus Berkelbacteria bacterium Licking1014_7 TaxID=2017147 RepID=A0A554LI12_9BACT|nr:MAG: hypothetical protein CEN89_667 [Candidatus Berkelbacteria bacterium Licking1014_7]